MLRQRFCDHPLDHFHSLQWTDPVSLGLYRCAPRAVLSQAEPCLDYVFNVPTSGAFVRRGRDGTVLADGNRAVWYDKHAQYRACHPSTGGDAGIYLRLSPSLTRALLEHHQESACDSPRYALPAVELSIAQKDRWYRLYHAVLSGVSDEDLYERAVALAGDLFERAQGVSRPQAMRTSSRQRVRWVQAHLANNIASCDSLDALAAEVGWTRFQLCRAFRRATASTVHAYRERLRMGAALHRLSRAHVDLTDLALALGYANHSHFTRRFRRHVGLTPSAWRAAQM